MPSVLARPAALLFSVVLLGACARREAPSAGAAASVAPSLPLASAEAPDEPSPSASIDVPDTASAEPPPAPSAEPHVVEAISTWTEAHRSTLRRVAADPRLAPHAKAVADHFAGKVPTRSRSSPLRSGQLRGDPARRACRRAEPVHRRRRPRPLAAIDQDRPLAGIALAIAEMALLPGPRAASRSRGSTRRPRSSRCGGGNRAGASSPTTSCSSSRSAKRSPASDTLPGRGFLVAASQLGAGRVQRLAENGRIAWGMTGRGLPWASQPDAPVGIVLDTEASAILFQVGFARATSGKNEPGHLQAYRVDAEGAALWPRPSISASPHRRRAPARRASGLAWSASPAPARPSS